MKKAGMKYKTISFRLAVCKLQEKKKKKEEKKKKKKRKKEEKKEEPGGIEPLDLSANFFFWSNMNSAVRNLNGHFCDHNVSSKFLREGVKSNVVTKHTTW